MPIYSYSCNDCSVVIEKRQSFSDDPLTTCEQCGGPLRKIIHPVGIVFKGSGWYVTDSRSSGSASRGASAKNGAAEGESAPAKTDSATKTDSTAKPESTSTPAPAASTPSPSAT